MHDESRSVTATTPGMSLATYCRRVLSSSDKLSLALIVFTAVFVANHIGEYNGDNGFESALFGLTLGTALVILITLFAWKRYALRWARYQPGDGNLRASGPYQQQVP